MGYTPTEWSTGDTITASKLNKIESGIANAGGALICNTNYSSTVSNYVLDKTVQEIYDALLSGTPVYIKYQYGTPSDYEGKLYLAPVVTIDNYNFSNVLRIIALKQSSYAFSASSKEFLFGVSALIYAASSLNDYPAFYASVYPKVDTATQDVGGIG